MKKVIYVKPEMDMIVMSGTEIIVTSGGTLGSFDDDTNNPYKEGSFGDMFGDL